MASLSWSLGVYTAYQAGETLETVVAFTAPEDGSYYLLGGLYDGDGSFLAGTLFGLVVPPGADYAINSLIETGLWELEAGAETELACKLTFNRTDVILGLFLMKMAGDAPSLEYDEEASSVSTVLSAANQATDMSSLIGMLAAVGLMAGMLPVALKE